ncbi:MAG: prolyl oligopeptidase family serine peptidase [Rhodanobacter sp.]
MRGFFAAFVLCVASSQALAGGMAPTPASVIPAIDFARTEQLTLPSLSPDGEYLAASVRDKVDADDDNRYAIGVFHVPDMKPISRMDMPKHYVPSMIRWVSNARLIVMPSRHIGSLESPVAGGNLIAVNFDGSHQKKMFDREDTGTRGTLAGLPEKPNGHFYWVEYKGSRHRISEGTSTLFDVNAENDEVLTIAKIGMSGMQFLLHDGVALIAYGEDDQGRQVIMANQGKNRPWWTIPTHDLLKPLYISDDGEHVYWQLSAHGGPYTLAISRWDLSNMHVLASDNFGDIDGENVEWTSYPQKPFAATLQTGLPRTVYLDDGTSATIHKALSEQFPHYVIHFVDTSEDGTRVLVNAYSDRDPGFYALFTLSPVSLKILFRARPWIHPDQMAARQPIRFKAADGHELDGYLTMPDGGRNLPLVLLPHGGPFDIRDNWRFDPWSQFLASRGYAVLQVNYRGSSGRGPGFKVAGFMQVGSGIQQDLLDGVHWAIDNGYANKDRVCVFGASFGGYSALMAPIRAPGMFKCSIDFAGITDYAIEFDKSDTQETAYGRNYFAQTIGTDPANVLAISPIDQLDQFNVPVLIVHGEKDPRVPLKNATELRSALDKAGKPYEWLVKPKELHGFYSEANNTELLEHIQAFLAKYIGDGNVQMDAAAAARPTDSPTAPQRP